MRPVLRPGLRLLRRPDGTAVLAERDRFFPIDRRTAGTIESLDGVHDERALDDRRPGSARVLARLTAHGVVVDVEAPARLARGVSTSRRATALREAAALATHDPETAEERWRRRRQAAVEVAGQGVLAPALVRLLTEAGVGEVRQVRRPTACDADVPSVLIDDHEPPTDVSLPLLRTGRTHLVAGFRGAEAVVGPTVRPGSTPCLRCIDLARRDADRDWATLREQISSPETGPRLPAAPAACTVVVAAAALAATDVLAEIEGRDPVSLGGTLTLSLLEPVPARRTWTRHPACGCSWPGAMNAPSQWSA